MTVGPEAETEKADQEQQEGADRHGDNTQQRDSSSPAQSDLAVSATAITNTTNNISPNGLEPAPPPQTAISGLPTNPIASTIALRTSSWASFFSSSRSMVNIMVLRLWA